MKETQQFERPERYKGHPIYLPKTGTPIRYSLPLLDIGAKCEEENGGDIGRKFELDLVAALLSVRGSYGGRNFLSYEGLPPFIEGYNKKQYLGDLSRFNNELLNHALKCKRKRCDKRLGSTSSRRADTKYVSIKPSQYKMKGGNE